MIRLVTLDVTGTLLLPEVCVAKQYAAALRKHIDSPLSRNPDYHLIQDSFWKSFKTHTKAYPLFGHKIHNSSKPWWLSIFLTSLVKSGTIAQSTYGIIKVLNHNSVALLGLEKEDDNPLYCAFEHAYYDFKWRTLPYSSLFLSSIKQQNRETLVGILTNNDDRVESDLRKTGLYHHVDFIITSGLCGVEKPDKEIFDLAIKTASGLSSSDNSISPSNTLHIGDSLEDDYVGALNAGCLALLLDPEGKYVGSGLANPEHCVKDLSVALDVFKKLTVGLTE